MNITIDIPLSTSQVGLTLKAALVSNDLSVHATYRNMTGIINLMGSIYHWEYDGLPDNFRGSLIFYTGTIIVNNLPDNNIIIKASAPIEPGSVAISGSRGSVEVVA